MSNYRIYVAFFFQSEEAAVEFIKTGDVNLAIGRKLFTSTVAIPDLHEMAVEANIHAGTIVLYCLDEIEPWLVDIGENFRECAS